MEKECRPSDIVVIIKSKLENEKAFNDLNLHFQIRKNWVIYSYVPSVKKFEILAFYLHVFLRLETNDFDKSNALYLKDKNFDVPTFGIF